jgi:hypothetical protein
MKTGKYICVVGLLLLLLSPAPSFAEITLIVSPDGDKAFTIEGDDINLTAKVELSVVYDSTKLANPRVSVEGGTVTDLMDSNPGILSFVANQGSVPTPSFVAHLSFDRTGDSRGGIFSVTGKITEKDGTITPSSTMPNPSNPSILAWGSDVGETEPPVMTEETATSGNRPDMSMKAEKSVLQRFREFKGERGLKAFVALFERGPRDTLVQEPPVALSDGKNPVGIRLEMQQKGGGAPNIALSDAKLVHLWKEGEKGWVITALPNEGTWNARLIVEMDEKRIEFPLVVAPPVKIDKGINERNFVAELDRFISDRVGVDKEENDPFRLILYEYFFTANYLAGSGNRSAEMASEQESYLSNRFHARKPYHLHR